MESEAIEKALYKTPIFRVLSANRLGQLAQKTLQIQFAAGQDIVYQGDPSNSLFIVINGIVSINKVMPNRESHTLAYLFPGMTFGEVGILENQPRSATVSALSDVSLLKLEREVFMELIYEVPAVGVELAKLLGRYLVESSRRQSLSDHKANLLLVYGIAPGIGVTTIANLLARLLGESTKERTLYMELPDIGKLKKELDLPHHTSSIYHTGIYDILLDENSDKYSPKHEKAKLTLLLDRVMKEYSNVVIGLPAVLDENANMMLDFAKQVIVLTNAQPSQMEEMKRFQRSIKKLMRLEEATLFVIRVQNELQIELGQQIAEDNDYELHYLPDFPDKKELLANVPQIPTQLKDLLNMFANRLEKTSQIGIYMPSTLDVANPIDPKQYVDQALDFMAKRFGGATCKEARGVWNSKEIGLVGEDVFLVNSYVTPHDLRKHLDEVVNFVKKIKVELRQEAMALEVNKKLSLI